MEFHVYNLIDGTPLKMNIDSTEILNKAEAGVKIGHWGTFELVEGGKVYFYTDGTNDYHIFNK